MLALDARQSQCLACCVLGVFVSDFVWILQGHNAFIRKNLNHTTFSAEAGNLYNKHSYKHSGALQQQQRAAVSTHAKYSFKQAAKGTKLPHSWSVTTTISCLGHTALVRQHLSNSPSSHASVQWQQGKMSCVQQAAHYSQVLFF
jgi:hypothetical protein